MSTTSLVTVTLAQLVDMIIELGAGAVMPPQDVLSKELGVSRTTVREAISKLEFLNILTIRPKHGTIINPLDQWKTHNAEVVEWMDRVQGVAA